MRLDVMDDFSRPHKVNGETPLTQRLASELAASKPTPPSIVVGTTSRITALTATAGM
jgi:hypothetical protein